MEKNVRKRIALMGLFLLGVFFTNAQTRESHPAWVVSKDVQKVANKKMYNDENMRKSYMMAPSVGTPSWIISKGVYRYDKESAPSQGNVAMKGYPSWIISKGVQRIKK